MKSLQSMPMFQGLRLVGGTGLALQLGHRKSIDLDFFGTIEADSLEIREALEESHVVSIVKESKNIHIYMVDGVKVDIVNYRYTWIDEPVIDSELTLASIKDIAAMKIAAVIGRGTKKDFIDIDILLRSFSLQELLDLYMQKYPDGSLFIAMKSLTPCPSCLRTLIGMMLKHGFAKLSFNSDFNISRVFFNLQQIFKKVRGFTSVVY